MTQFTENSFLRAYCSAFP